MLIKRFQKYLKNITPNVTIFFILILVLFIYSFFIFVNRIKNFMNNTNRIAIVSSINYHFECIGFLCELFKNYNIDVYHVPEMNNENYIEYFKNFYPNLRNFKLNKLTLFKEYSYSKIIKLTSHDNIKIKSNEKVLSIHHFYDKKEQLLDKKYITLSPLVKSTLSSINILPIYRITINIHNNNFNNKTIIFIGRVFNNNIDIFDNFLGKINYKIIFFCRHKEDPSSVKFNNLNNKNKIKYYYCKNINFMINKINKSTFFYIDKKDDRFSGSITLALSNNIPIIIDEFQKKKYGFPAITYVKNITEIIDKLNNISKDEYNEIVNKQMNFSKKILDNYPNQLKKLI
jgi:hypothetical protein